MPAVDVRRLLTQLEHTAQALRRDVDEDRLPALLGTMTLLELQALTNALDGLTVAVEAWRTEIQAQTGGRLWNHS